MLMHVGPKDRKRVRADRNSPAASDRRKAAPGTALSAIREGGTTNPHGGDFCVNRNARRGSSCAEMESGIGLAIGKGQESTDASGTDGRGRTLGEFEAHAGGQAHAGLA
jgi:hypothetical protein